MDDERRLIRRVQRRGDRVAADTLVRRYYNEIYRFVRKQVRDESDALDITQETFIGALRTIGGYDSARAGFRTWLYRIATNKVIDFVRSKSRQCAVMPLTDYQLNDNELIEDSDFTQRVLDGDLIERVQAYLNVQPTDSQRIFRLRLFGGYTFNEIAAMLSMPLGSVKSRYYRLISQIRKEESDDER
ncbi:RNA polymerase sigma factor [Clostridia bacterium]|nr:RNA polymerase sigma factor [Clostridia bacterium]